MRDISDMWNDDREIPDCPAWCEGMTYADAAAISEGGCASGAWMPAVTYHTALGIMREHGDAVIQYLEDADRIDFVQFEAGDSWAGFAVKVVSSAVEAFADSVVRAWEDDCDDCDDYDDCDDCE